MTNMLETRDERVGLLKSGIHGKAIEKIYLEANNIKIVNKNLLFTVEQDNETNG